MQQSGLTLFIVAVAACGGSGDDSDSLVGRVDAAPADAAPPDAARDAGTIVGADATVLSDAAVVVPPDAAVDPPDAAVLPDADGCAVSRVDRWTGTSHVRFEGSGGYDQTSATVTWQRVDTVDCVDRYRPSGTARWDWFGGLCLALVLAPTTAAIASTDGELIVDRTGGPVSYAVHGETRWPATITCTLGEPPVDEVTDTIGGGDWVEASGTVSGGRIDGTQDEGNRESAWSFGPA